LSEGPSCRLVARWLMHKAAYLQELLGGRKPGFILSWHAHKASGPRLLGCSSLPSGAPGEPGGLARRVGGAGGPAGRQLHRRRDRSDDGRRGQGCGGHPGRRVHLTRRLLRAAARAAGPRASASRGRAAEPSRSALEVPGAVDGGCTSSARDTDTSARRVPLRVVPRAARRGYRGAGAASVTCGADNLLRGVPPADKLCCVCRAAQRSSQSGCA